MNQNFDNTNGSSGKSMDTQIYIKEPPWKAAITLAVNNDINQINSYDTLSQFRQLRSRSHHQSTYIRCRAFNEPTDDAKTRPFTIFTLTDWDTGLDNSDYRIGSSLFQAVAESMIDGTGKLQVDKISRIKLKLKLKSNKDMDQYFGAILKLFGDQKEMDILGNEALNNPWKSLQIRWRLLSPKQMNL